MPDLEISNSDRKELVGNILSVLEIVPENALVTIRNSLEKHESLDSLKIKRLTGLGGQSLESLLLLFQSARTRREALLVSLDTALAVAQNTKKDTEVVDLSWTGPIQFHVEGRTTVSVMEEMIRNACTSVTITGYSITQSASNFIHLLEKAVAKKIDVVLVIHSDDEGSNLKTLSRLWTSAKKTENIFP